LPSLRCTSIVLRFKPAVIESTKGEGKDDLDYSIFTFNHGQGKGGKKKWTSSHPHGNRNLDEASNFNKPPSALLIVRRFGPISYHVLKKPLTPLVAFQQILPPSSSWGFGNWLHGSPPAHQWFSELTISSDMPIASIYNPLK
jgi:hypothetical protein